MMSQANICNNSVNQSIVPMAFCHLDDIVELERQAFNQPWSRQMLESELDNPLAYYFCFLQDNEVIGYFGMHKILDEGHITNICVKASMRRRKIATALIAYALDFCVANEIAALTLEVRPSNQSAIALYEGFGFKTEGRRKRYYHDNEDALIMWLRF